MRVELKVCCFIQGMQSKVCSFIQDMQSKVQMSFIHVDEKNRNVCSFTKLVVFFTI
jgi:hypothetical protein